MMEGVPNPKSQLIFFLQTQLNIPKEYIHGYNQIEVIWDIITFLMRGSQVQARFFVHI